VDPQARRHHVDMEIRVARLADAAEVCHVLRRSITDLCDADHHNDPAILDRWLANKTPANIAAWIDDPEGYMFVALENGIIVGVASITTAGEITLNYVSPDARFRGVSKALLARLEAKATALGHTHCILTSTVTARQLYRSVGYLEKGPPTAGFFTAKSLRMRKDLPQSPSVI
jgi:GNAT superfamily N-acetyltransferase